jgi:hypothetical protein
MFGSLDLRSLVMRMNGVMSSSIKGAAGRTMVHADTAAARTCGWRSYLPAGSLPTWP